MFSLRCLLRATGAETSIVRAEVFSWQDLEASRAIECRTVAEIRAVKSVAEPLMTKPSGRIVSIQYWSIGLLIAGGALNYVDRATLSVANKLIQEDLGIPVAKMGLLLSAFLWAYAFAQLPVGGLIDRYGPRKMLALGLFAWSVAQAAGGLVKSFGMFVVARAALGLGEAPLFPGGARVVRDWFNIRQRGIATGPLPVRRNAGQFHRGPNADFSDDQTELALDVSDRGRGWRGAGNRLVDDSSRSRSG